MTHRFQRMLLVLLTLVLVGFSWLGRFELTADAAVTLVSFDVVRGAASSDLNIVWETATETDVVGFRVKRSTTSNVQQATVVKTVPSRGSATTGYSYDEPDSGLTTGQTYYYWLYELKNDSTENLLTNTPESEAPGGPSSPTNTPTFAPTTVPTQQPTRTPTATQVSAPKQPTSTPTVLQGVNPSATPTTPAAQATATFTVPPQATDTPIGEAPTQQPTNTSVPVAPDQTTNTPVPVAQVQATDTPVVSVPTPIVEGQTPNPSLPTPEVKAGATVGAVLEGRAVPADQTLQVPPTPTEVLDAAAANGTTSVATPTLETTDSTPQAVAQEAASGSAPSTERLVRPTATPRPSATAESSSGSGSLLLILGGASLFGAVVLALAALVIWRRR